LQLAYGVANEGEAAPDGLPNNLLLRLPFVRLTEGFLPGIALILQKAVFGFAAWLASVTGLEVRLTKYSSSSTDGQGEGEVSVPPGSWRSQ